MTQTSKANGVNGHAAVQLYQPPKKITRRKNPKQEIADWKKRAQAARAEIAENKWSVPIRGREHIKIEGWTALGLMFGYTAQQDPSSVVERGEVGSSSYRAYCRVLKEHPDGTTVEVGGAFGACGIDEPEWVERPKYEYQNGRRNYAGKEPVSDQQRLSMAQTRAASKALSLVLRAIAEMAGYSGTPAEEMHGADRDQSQDRGVARSAPAPSPKKHDGPSQQRIKNLCQKMIQAGITPNQICQALECDRSVMRVRLAQVTWKQHRALEALLKGKQ